MTVEEALVEADRLQGLGDPRGELMALQIRLESAGPPERPRILVEERRCLARGGERLLPRTVERPHVELGWFRGYLQSITYRQASAAYLEALLTHPSASRLEILEVEPSSTQRFGWLVDLIAAHAAPSLVRLQLGPTPLPSLIPLKRLAARRIENLDLRGELLDEKLELRGVRRLAVRVSIADADSVPRLCRHTFPDLESLELSRGRYRPENLAPLYEGSAFPRLKRLVVREPAWPGDLRQALQTSPLARRLTTCTVE